MNRWSALAVLLALAGALAFRLPHLDTRPLHNDEAVNAFKVTDLWLQGRYLYDPDEYHGPTLHYASLPFLALKGVHNVAEVDDATLRLAPLAFGVALILLIPLLIGGLSPPAIAWAALFVALSPAMVFYSRYFIHEILLVFFTALLLAAGWRYSQKRSLAWAVVGGGAVGLMFATKETFVLSLAAMAAAGAGTLYSLQRQDSARAVRAWLGSFQRGHALAFAFSLFLVWLLFFSSFFTHLHGLPDSIRTYFPWLKRAAGHSPHLHPWYFYLQRIGWFHSLKGPVWSEGLILILALVGGVRAFIGKPAPFIRFLALYTLFLTAAYSAISYKTPWCLLNFLFGMILLAGVGAAGLLECCRTPLARFALLGGLIAATAQLGVQSWRASFVYASDRRNPYVYAQTVPDVLNLVRRAEGLAKVSAAGLDTVVKTMAPNSDYWPLPWYLRNFKNTGWYESLPEDPYAPIVIAASQLEARLDEKSNRKWIMAGMTELRPGRFLELYVDLELWKKYVETLPPQPD